MTEQIYSMGRPTVKQNTLFDEIQAEMRTYFEAAKTLLDGYLDKHETYRYNKNGFKILNEDCTPVKIIEAVHLLTKNDIAVGQVIIRVRNTKPKHSVPVFIDTLERTYELRFKTFAGCDFTIESSGISMTKTGVNPIFINSCSMTGMEVMILKKHWDEFKTNCTFTEDDLKTPTKFEMWGPNNIVLAN